MKGFDKHLTISWIALALSTMAIIVSLVVAFPRQDLGFDYLGFIVGILALLVTVLIGWDIYKAVSIEKTIAEKTAAAEGGAACLSLSQLGLVLYRMDEIHPAVTALTNALSSWQPRTSDIGNDGANNAQHLLCTIFTEGRVDYSKIAEEIYLLRRIKYKLTNNRLCQIIDAFPR